jgi:hypothetical protein
MRLRWPQENRGVRRMPLPRTGSVSGGNLPPNGIQARFLATKGTFRPDTRFGPDIELSLDMVDEKYFGTPAKFWVSVQQPRLDLVRKWRKDKMKDKTIAQELRDRGFEFNKIDDPDEMVVGRGGNLYQTLVAVCGGDRQKAEEVLDRVESFEELAEYFVDKGFVATTKIKTKNADSGEERKFVNIDGQEEIYPDYGSTADVEAEIEADLDELPDDAPEAEPEAPWKTPDEENAA